MPKRIEISTLFKKKKAGEKITMLTAYDYPTAKMLDESGVDTILVGDSGNEVLTTIPDWPKIQVEVQGKAISRPDILVVK